MHSLYFYSESAHILLFSSPHMYLSLIRVIVRYWPSLLSIWGMAITWFNCLASKRCVVSALSAELDMRTVWNASSTLCLLPTGCFLCPMRVAFPFRIWLFIWSMSVSWIRILNKHIPTRGEIVYCKETRRNCDDLDFFLNHLRVQIRRHFLVLRHSVQSGSVPIAPVQEFLWN